MESCFLRQHSHLAHRNNTRTVRTFSFSINADWTVLLCQLTKVSGELHFIIFNFWACVRRSSFHVTSEGHLPIGVNASLQGVDENFWWTHENIIKILMIILVYHIVNCHVDEIILKNSVVWLKLWTLVCWLSTKFTGKCSNNGVILSDTYWMAPDVEKTIRKPSKASSIRCVNSSLGRNEGFQFSWISWTRDLTATSAMFQSIFFEIIHILKIWLIISIHIKNS